MHRALLFATLALGCGRSEGVPDDKLGALVIAPKQKAEAIDVAKAAKDPKELGRALMLPHGDVAAALGPHTFVITTSTVVEEGGKKVNELTDTTKIELGANEAYQAVYSNSADYGRGTGDCVMTSNDLAIANYFIANYSSSPNQPCNGTAAQKIGLQPGNVNVGCDAAHYWSFHSGGALFLRDDRGWITGVAVPAPSGSTDPPAAGEGWTLKLAEGWEIAPGQRPGDWLVRPAGGWLREQCPPARATVRGPTASWRATCRR